MTTKRKRMVRYTAGELKALRKQGNHGTDWDYVLNMSQEEANRLAESDPDDPIHAVLRKDIGEHMLGYDTDTLKQLDASRRKAKKRPQQQAHVKLDRDIVRFFRKGGRGYGSRINKALRAYVEAIRPNQ